MSKIGKKLISLPQGVQVTAEAQQVKVTGPKGELDLAIHPKVKITVTGSEVSVSVNKPDDRRQRALWGTFRSLISSMVVGVTAGFEKKLEIVGVGYKASVSGEKLVLALGFSHPVELQIPKGLAVKVEKNVITVTGSDKQVVGQFAAEVRSLRKPEPYKGKGIKYSDEVVRRKAGKVVKAVGG